MKTRLTPILGAVLGLALLASACGGSDGGSASEEDQELIDAVAAQFESEGDVPPGVDTNCMAAAMVNGLGGAENIESEYGLTVADVGSGNTDALDAVELPADEARSLASGMLDCGLGEVMIESMTAGSGLSEEDAGCLLGALDEDIIRDIMASEFMSDADAATIAQEAQTELFSGLFDAVGDCDLDPAALGLGG